MSWGQSPKSSYHNWVDLVNMLGVPVPAGLSAANKVIRYWEMRSAYSLVQKDSLPFSKAARFALELLPQNSLNPWTSRPFWPCEC